VEWAAGVGMDLYTGIDLLVLALPLALSFDRKVAFWRKWPQVFAAIVAVLLVFGAWDAWMASRGIWSFNSAHAGNWRFLHLPLGEWLFFACVPYAGLFVLACVRAYFPDRTWRVPQRAFFIPAVVCCGLAWVFHGLFYTATVIVSVASVLALMELVLPGTLRSRNFWAALGLTYVPFLIVNGVLTGLPIVLYDNAENLAIRAGPIPLEDFFFSFSMLALAVVVHDFIGKRRGAA
jgi:lycopene cyclase domain-containing protein